MKLVIDRTKWYRGKENSALRRKDGMQCCLGFLGVACEVERKGLDGVFYPLNLGPHSSDKWPSWLFERSNFRHLRVEINGDLAIINDDQKISDDQREKELTHEFKKHGVEVEFIG